MVSKLFSITALWLIALAFIQGCTTDPQVASPSGQTPPLSPVNVIAVALSTDSIRLSWEDRSQTEEGFEIFERVGDNGSFAMLAAITVPDVESLVLTGKLPATNYSYFLKTYNQSGKSDSSNIAVVTTPDDPPKSPTNLQGTRQEDTVILLTWADSSSNEQGFRIERKIDGEGSWTTSGEVERNITQFSDETDVEPNSTYAYRVIAFNGMGASNPSNECTVYPKATTKPTAPTAKYVQAISSTRIDFRWEPSGTNHAGFKISRKKSSEEWADAAEFDRSAGITVLEDGSLEPQTSYDYRVLAYNEKGNSPPSSVLTGRTPSENSLFAPSNLRVEVISSTELLIWWQDNSNDEEGFKVQRKASGSDWTEVKSCAVNDTAYFDTNVTTRTEYRYRVVAFKGAELSAVSNEVVATPRIATPQSLTATAKSATRIELRWVNNVKEESGYRLERKLSEGAWGEVTKTAVDVTSYMDTDLVPYTSYSYRISAFNVSDSSDYSDEVQEGTYELGVPGSLTAMSKSTSIIDLFWVDNSGDDETGFVLERHAGNLQWISIPLPAHSIAYRDSALVPNTTYTYRAYAVCKNVSSAFSNETSAATSSLATPGNLTATMINSTSIALKWEDRSYDELGFKIERRIGNAGWGVLGETDADSLSFTDSGLTPDTTYNYRLYAYHQTGQSSFSNEVTVTPMVAVPTDLKAIFTSSSSLALVWKDNSPDESGFKIEKRVGDGGWVECGTTAANINQLLESGLTPGVIHHYRVRAYHQTGKSVYSDELEATPILPAPTDMNASAKNSTTIEIGWTDNSGDETGYKLERREAGGNWSDLTTLNSDEISYLDKGLTPETEYSYRVRAYIAIGFSAYSDVATVKTKVLPAPTNVLATAKSSAVVELLWQDNSDEESGYQIERKTGADAWAEVKTAAVNATLWLDSSLVPETRYLYRMRTFHQTGESAYCNQVIVTTPAIIAPSSLSATLRSSSSIELKWNDNSKDENGFKIERKSGADNWGEIKTVAKDSSGFLDTKLTPGVKYYYRVKAFHQSGISVYTNEANNTPVLPAPTLLTATVKNSSSITLKWTDKSPDEAGFKVERKEADGDWAEVDSVLANATSVVDTGLVRYTTYTYRVRAFIPTGFSAYGNEDSESPYYTPFDTLTGHTDYVHTLAVSPDGTILASGSEDHSIKLWRVSDGALIRTLNGHNLAVQSLAFSPDGRTLASGSFKVILLWRVADGAILDTLNEHSHMVLSLAFSPNGATLASGCMDNVLKIWRVADGICLKTIADHTGYVYSLAFSPNGATLASASGDKTVKLWKTADWKILRTLAGHTSYVISVAFSSDGASVISGGTEKAIRFWRVADGVCTNTMQLNGDDVYDVALSPDEKQIVTGGPEWRMNVWDIASGDLITMLTGHRAQVRCIQLCPDGNTLASGSTDETVILWK